MSQLGPLFLCTINVNGENGGVHEDPLDYLTLRYLFVRQCVCVFALHETDHRKVREINVTRYTFYGSVEE